MMWSSTIGLVEPVGLPASSNRAIGQDAVHISSSMMVPLIAPIHIPAPRISATPIPSRPSMNSQSRNALPAIERYIEANGPTWRLPRKPAVGEPPLIHALADGVEWAVRGPPGHRHRARIGRPEHPAGSGHAARRVRRRRAVA